MSRLPVFIEKHNGITTVWYCDPPPRSNDRPYLVTNDRWRGGLNVHEIYAWEPVGWAQCDGYLLTVALTV